MKKQSQLIYDVTNNSYGTIYNLSVRIDAWHDRGDNVRSSLASSLSVNDPIALGATSSQQMYYTRFDTSCKYLTEIKLLLVANESCNIRMLPEDVNFIDLIKLDVGNMPLKIREEKRN